MLKKYLFHKKGFCTVKKEDKSCIIQLYHTQGNVGIYERLYSQILWLQFKYTKIIMRI